MHDFRYVLLKLGQKYASLCSVYRYFLTNQLGAAAFEIFRSLPFRNMATYRITYGKGFSCFLCVSRRVLNTSVKLTAIVSRRIPRDLLFVTCLPYCIQRLLRLCNFTKFYSRT
jgi:hypothetical protein